MATYVAVVALIVFWPTTAMNDASINEIWRVLHALGAPAFVSPNLIEFATNIVLFMPLSFLGHFLRPQWGWRQWLLAGLAPSVVIELTQALFLSGRVPSVVDVTANTLGALAGYLLVVTSTRRT